MKTDKGGRSWYRFPIMWLVLGLPAGAVLAGVVTFVIILKHPDPEVSRPDVAAAAARIHAANSIAPPAD